MEQPLHSRVPIMATPFSRTSRALSADNSRRSGLLAVGLGTVLITWLAWFTLARVTVHEVTSQARLEVARAAHEVQAPVAGTIVRSNLSIGQEVQADEVLVELDASMERLRLREEEARVATLTRQLEVIAAERMALTDVAGLGKQALAAAQAEASARLREAEASSRLASEQAGRLQKLHDTGQLSKAEYERARAQAKQRRAAADAAASAMESLSLSGQTKEGERRARLAELEREIAVLEGELEQAKASAEVLAKEIDLRKIRTPVAGRVGGVLQTQIGAWVEKGTTFGSVVPAGDIKVVAYFRPQAALGRVQPGQRAKVRLQGFPWSQFGSVLATVERVATELRNGAIRVELRVDQVSSRIHLQHGLPGTVEVEVEEVAPVVLVLRAAGQLLAEPLSSPVEVTTSESVDDAKS